MTGTGLLTLVVCFPAATGDPSRLNWWRRGEVRVPMPAAAGRLGHTAGD